MGYPNLLARHIPRNIPGKQIGALQNQRELCKKFKQIRALKIQSLDRNPSKEKSESFDCIKSKQNLETCMPSKQMQSFGSNPARKDSLDQRALQEITPRKFGVLREIQASKLEPCIKFKQIRALQEKLEVCLKSKQIKALQEIQANESLASNP